MALVLSLYQGDTFYVDEKAVTVTNVREQDDFDLATDEGLYSIGPVTWTQIFQETYAQASDHQPNDSRMVRIRINAPGQHVGRNDPTKEKQQ